MKPTTFLAAARSELGYSEQPKGSNDTKFAAEAGQPNGYAWCQTFLVAIAKRTGLVLPRNTASTLAMANAFKADGRWFTEPARGAFVFFDFPGKPDRISHVGVVEAVRPDGSIVTIEGNTDEAGGRTGGKVMRKVRRAYIVGYGYPRYAQSQNGKLRTSV